MVHYHVGVMPSSGKRKAKSKEKNDISIEADNKKETSNVGVDEEEESNVEKEIKTWAVARGLDKSIRTLTTTVAIETVILPSPKFDVLKYTKDASRCLGILSADATLLANYISTHDAYLDLLTSGFGEYTFYRSCYDVCVGITNNVDTGVLYSFGGV